MNKILLSAALAGIFAAGIAASAQAADATAPAATMACPKDGGKAELNNGMWVFGDAKWAVGTKILASKNGTDCMVAPDGVHTLKDGKTKVTVKGGMITDVSKM